MMFLSIQNLDQRRETYKKAAQVLEYIRKYDLEQAIEKYKKKTEARGAAVKELKKTTLNEVDALKTLLSDMLKLDSLTQEDTAVILTTKDASVAKFGKIMDALHDIYLSSQKVYDNVRLQKYLQEKAKVLSGNNKIKTIIDTKSIRITTVRNKADQAVESNRFVIDGELSIKQFYHMVTAYAFAIIAIVRVYLGYKKISDFPASLTDAYNSFKIRGTGLFLKQFLNAVIAHVGSLSVQASIQDLKSQLEIVETLDRYFDPVTKQYNVANVYEHLLAPLTAIYEQYKDKINDPEALASLHRLTNFGTFQRFPSNVPMQTKYLHSMSVAANMLKSYMLNDHQIDSQDVERSYAEWPFEFEPGATLHI